MHRIGNDDEGEMGRQFLAEPVKKLLAPLERQLAGLEGIVRAVAAAGAKVGLAGLRPWVACS